MEDRPAARVLVAALRQVHLEGHDVAGGHAQRDGAQPMKLRINRPAPISRISASAIWEITSTLRVRV